MSGRICPNCGRSFRSDIDTCTFCRVGLGEEISEPGVIIACTRVDVAFTGHDDVPYWVALVEGPSGLRFLKTDTRLEVGNTVGSPASLESPLRVYGVVGTGLMGSGLTELLLLRGHRAVWVGRSAIGLAKGRDRVLGRLSRVLDERDVQAASERLQCCTDYAPLGVCDVVIESVTEDVATKTTVLAAAEQAMRPDALLATNTSGLPLDVLADALARPERFGGLHFFNPPTRMRLVETVVCSRSSAATSADLDDIALSLGKTPVRVASTPAFAANRALMPLLNEAVRELEDGVAPAESIDDAVRLGLNHPMGPLALADLIGLDVVVHIMNNLAERTGDTSYLPRPLLVSMVEAGKLGRKTGAGFYNYPARPTNIT